MDAPTARGNDPPNLQTSCEWCLWRFTRPGGAFYRRLHRAPAPPRSETVLRRPMPAQSGRHSVVTFYWCYHQDSPLLAGILGSPPLGICASLFCGELLPSSYQCPHMRPACVSSLIFMGMWWETDSWLLRVQSAFGARYSSVAELATRYSVFRTYSPPFLGMNIYIIFENTSRTSLDHKWCGLLPLLVMKT